MVSGSIHLWPLLCESGVGPTEAGTTGKVWHQSGYKPSHTRPGRHSASSSSNGQVFKLSRELHCVALNAVLHKCICHFKNVLQRPGDSISSWIEIVCHICNIQCETRTKFLIFLIQIYVELPGILASDHVSCIRSC